MAIQQRTKDKIWQMHLDGASFKDIAKRTGKTYQMCARVVNDRKAANRDRGFGGYSALLVTPDDLRARD